MCLCLALTACATQPETAVPEAPPGFLKGLWHGFIMLFSLIGSAFMDVRIYAYPNQGGWYDLGFFIGAAMFLGGGGASTGTGGSKNSGAPNRDQRHPTPADAENPAPPNDPQETRHGP
jgi:hypothetical protein